MTNILSLDQIRQTAPSVFATQPWHAVSDAYRFVPTIEVFSALVDNGFLPVKASQAKTRIEGKGEFTRHVIRFRHADVLSASVGDTLPEIVLMNSHDRSSAYKIMLGMFRLVCSNGMVVCSSMMDEVSARHSGSKNLVQEVIDGSFRIIENAPRAMKQIEQWQNTQLTTDQAEAYAVASVELRDTVIKPRPEQLLRAYRSADTGNDIWSTMNRVQENTIKGGHRTYNANRQLRTTRGIKSVNEDVKFNRALWMLTEKLAEAVAA